MAAGEHDSGVAVVGMSCRFPKAENIPEFWQLLCNAEDAVTEVPPERWNIDEYFNSDPQAPGKMYTRWGGFIKDVEQFDPAFFGILPKEAARLDPQQRICLELAWHALEDAAIAPHSLKGSKTGVFVGVGNTDYARQLCQDGDNIVGYNAGGGTLSFTANRISYLLDLHGPSLAVESACSSSLVALNLAVESLRSGKSALALMGGANLVLSPDMTVTFSQAKMMSPVGKCKAFDASADGYVRAEGGGFLVLKPLTQAIADGNKIYAVIKGTAINHDGLSNGISAPNAQAQMDVIASACADAGVSPGILNYVEAHGTGTAIGDPIEYQSLLSTLNVNRSQDTPCYVGAVKTNIGHLEAAAGIAGVIKTILILKYSQIPPNLHYHTRNPRLPQSDWLRIPQNIEPLPKVGDRATAGVSGFSFGGTNAHIVLQSFEQTSEAGSGNTPVIQSDTSILTFSAKSPESLSTLVRQFMHYLAEHPDTPLPQLGYTLATGRNHYAHRLSLLAKNPEHAQQQMQTWLGTGESGNTVFHKKTIKRHAADLVFMFAGQGELLNVQPDGFYQNCPVFRDALNQCDNVLRPYLNESIVAILTNQETNQLKLQTARFLQPVLFALEYALVQVWLAMGIRPKVLIGHSLGEYVAACVAGVFSLEDGLKLIASRGALCDALPEKGKMLSVRLSSGEIQTQIKRLSLHNTVKIAAINGKKSTVVSGSDQAIEALQQALSYNHILCKTLDTTNAFHSHLMLPMMDEFHAVASDIEYKAPQIKLINGLTGQFWEKHEIPDASHWCRHLVEEVNFFKGVSRATESKHALAIELGTSNLLARILQMNAPDAVQECLPSLSISQQTDEHHQLQFLQNICRLYVYGIEANWRRLFNHHTLLPDFLPSYPFNRQPYWHKQQLAYQAPQSPNAPSQSGEELASVSPANTERPQGDDANKVTTHRGNVETMPADLINELKRLTSQVLGLSGDELDVYTHFLELGADSLVLAELISKVAATYQVDLTIAQLFDEFSTIEKLSLYLAQKSNHVRGATDTSGEQLSNTQSTVPQTAQLVLEQKIQNVSEQQVRAMQTSNPHEQQAALTLALKQLEIMELQWRSFSDGQAITSSPSTSDTTVSNTPDLTAFQETVSVQPLFSPKQSEQATVTELSGTSKLNQKKKQFLNEFITKYSAKTAASKARAQLSRPVMADSRASAGFRQSIKNMLYPIVGERASGAYFWDIDGNKYVDVSMGFGVLLLGHKPEVVQQAVNSQLERGIIIGPQANQAEEVARLIHELTGAERSAFCNSGTEAIMTAVRLARNFTKRRKIVKFSGSYHGHYDGVLVNESEKPAFAGVPPEFAQSVYVQKYDASALPFIEANAQDIAAVLVEPIQSRHPDYQPRDFLKALRKLTSATGIVLIFDEILTGFRLAPGGAQECFGVKADLSTYGKIAGGGLAIGIVAGKQAIMNGIDGGSWQYGDDSYPAQQTTFFAGTFNKNHLVMASSAAILSHLKRDNGALYTTLNELTRGLASELNHHFQHYKFPIKVVYCGSMFRFQHDGNLDIFFYMLIEKGIYIWEGRNCFLSTAHTQEDVQVLLEAVKAVTQELSKAGWFANSNTGPSAQIPVAKVASQICCQSIQLAELDKKLEQLRKTHHADDYAQGMSILNYLVLSYIYNTLQALAGENQELTFDSLQTKIIAKHHRLLQQLIQRVTEGPQAYQKHQKLYQSLGITEQTCLALSIETQQSLISHLELHFPGVHAEMNLVLRCVDQLTLVLVGEVSAVELLFPAGDMELATRVYTDSPMSALMNAALGDAIEALLSGPQKQQISILELGAGTGGTTQYLLPVIKDRPVRYCFSDISPLFLAQAKRTFAEYPFVEYELLDIESQQQPEQYDIIVAANVLHATVDTHKTLHNVNTLLKPGGVLVLLEISQSAPWLDVVFSLTDGWWRFGDTQLRKNGPLLSADQWQSSLQASGLELVQNLQSHELIPDVEQSLFVARKPMRCALSDNQYAMWVVSSMGQAASRAYNILVRLQLHGELDPVILNKSVARLFSRHQVLTTKFAVDGQWQEINSLSFSLPDVVTHSKASREEAQEFIANWQQHDFDLTSASLVKIHLLEVDDQCWLLFLAHHLVLDGQSVALLVNDLLAIYQSEQDVVVLPEPPQFSDYLGYCSQLSQQDMVVAKEYWLSQFEQRPPKSTLPGDFSRPDIFTHKGARASLSVDGTTLAQLTELSKDNGATLFMTLLTAFELLVAWLSKANDFVVGVSAAGQSIAQQPVVGNCVNVLPVRFTFDEDISFQELLRTTREKVIKAYQHQDYPFASLVKDISEKRDASRSSMLDLYFNFDKKYDIKCPEGMTVKMDSYLPHAVRRDITWNVVEEEDGLTVICDYYEGLYSQARITSWMMDYQALLSLLFSEQDKSVAHIFHCLENASKQVKTQQQQMSKKKIGSKIGKSRRKNIAIE